MGRTGQSQPTKLGRTGQSQPTKRKAITRERGNKRLRGESSSGENIFSEEFVTKEGEERFHKLAQPLLSERGVNVNLLRYQWMTDLIEDFGWTEFCKEPQPAYDQIIRTFYANFLDMRGGRVYVKGIWVPVSAAIINRTLGLEGVEENDDAYCIAKANPPSNDDLVKALCADGSVLKIVCNKKKITSKSLRREASFLHHWIGARIIPSSCFTDVTAVQAKLMYALLDDENFVDVGRVIYEEMSRPSDVKKSLGYPQLITQLCTNAGVVLLPSVGPIIPPMGPITDSTLDTYGSKSNSEPAEDSEAPLRRRSKINQRQMLADLKCQMDAMTVKIGEIQGVQNQIVKVQQHQADYGRYILSAIRFLAERGDMTGFPAIPDSLLDPNGSDTAPES